MKTRSPHTLTRAASLATVCLIALLAPPACTRTETRTETLSAFGRTKSNHKIRGYEPDSRESRGAKP